MSVWSMTEIASRGLNTFAMIAMVGLVGVTAVDVVGRVAFGAPLGFAYELIGVLLGVAVYAGLSRVNLLGQHVQIDLLEVIFNDKGGFNRLRVLVISLMEVTFYAIVAIYIFRQMFALKRWNETFLFLPMEKWLPLALFGSLASLAVVAALVANFERSNTQEGSQR